MKLSYYKLRDSFDKLAPIYILTGEQDLLRELAIHQIEEAALGSEKGAFNLERFDGEEATGDRVMLSANVMPMLGGRRVVVVRRAIGFVEEPRARSDNLKPGSRAEAFQQYASDPAPQTILVLELQKKPDGRRKLWKEIEKKTTVVQCDAPRDSELESWIVHEASERELRLNREVIRYLLAEFGADLRRLLNELEKLSLYAGGQNLDVDAVAEVLGRGKAKSIFKFTDAVAAGDTPSALSQLGRLIEEGEPPLRILALLDRLVGQLRVAKELVEAGSERRLARALGVPPFVARSLGSQVHRFSGSELEDALRLLSTTDRLLKRSALPARLAIENLVVFLCRRVPPTAERRRLQGR